MKSQELGLKTQKQVFITRNRQTSAHSSFPSMNGKQTSKISDSFGFLKRIIGRPLNNSPNLNGGDVKNIREIPSNSRGYFST